MTLTESLGLKPGDRASLTGAGGKTRTLYRIARENLFGTGLYTTTTKMRDPRLGSHPFDSVLIGSRTAPPPTDQAGPRCFLAERELRKSGRTDKVGGFSPGILDLWQFGPGWSILVVEADGAAGRPLKMPDRHEPVIPENTTVTIGVIGVDVLMQPAGEEWIHRFPLVRDRTGINEGEPVRAEIPAAVASHPEGLFRNSPAGSRRILILNKMDSLKDDRELLRLIDLLRADSNPPERILLTSLKDSRNPVRDILIQPTKRSRHVSL